jgi:hypothetical protein
MGKKKVNAPPPPDPTKVAQAQTESNINAANFNANLNRVNTNNPFASQTWSHTTDANGNPVWTSDTSLSKGTQSLYDTASSPFEFQGLGDAPEASSVMQGLPDMPTTADNAGREAVTNSMMQLMQPQIDRDRESQRAALANQGITMGSQPWQAAQQAQGDNENRLRLNAVLAGGQEQSRLYNLGLAGRQQRFGENQATFQNALARRGQLANEQVTARNLPFANMQSVYSMTPQAQIATAQAGPADIGGYTYNSYAGEQNNYNQQMAKNNAITSGLFGLGGAAITALNPLKKLGIA